MSDIQMFALILAGILIVSHVFSDTQRIATEADIEEMRYQRQWEPVRR